MLDNMSRNGMHQMGFSKTRVSVKEKRIVNMQRRIFCYIECCRICHRIALTGYKGFKRMTLTQIRILIDQWLFFFFIKIGRNTIIFFINEVDLGDFFTFDDTFNRNTDIKIVTFRQCFVTIPLLWHVNLQCQYIIFIRNCFQWFDKSSYRRTGNRTIVL